jgi:uracil-DNA glycosylase
MPDDDLPTLNETIENCKDCPRFKSHAETHWSGASGDVYTCTQAKRTIMPSDGIKPPPTWCPKRKSNQ